MGNKIKTMKRKLSWILIVALIVQLFSPLIAQPVLAAPVEELESSPENSGYRSPQGSPAPHDYGIFQNVTHTLTLDADHEQLCKRNLTGEIIFDWPDQSTFLDVVFIQDFSSTFRNSITRIGGTVKNIIASLNMGTDVDGVSPRDRAMIVTYQGDSGLATILGTGYAMYNNSSGDFTIRSTNLTSQPSELNAFIDENFRSNSSKIHGQAPTIDGMVAARDLYLENTSQEGAVYNRTSYTVNDGDTSLQRTRKTIYVLITDGAANTAKWNNIPSAAQAELDITSTWFPSDPLRSYLWTTYRDRPFSFPFYRNPNRVERYEAISPMLTGMGIIAEGLRTSGGLFGETGREGATFVSVLSADTSMLSSSYAGYGDGWGNSILPLVEAKMLEMTGGDPRLYASGTMDFEEFGNNIINAFKMVTSDVIDRVKIESSTGTIPQEFKLYKKNDVGNYELVPPRAGEQSSVSDNDIIVDMQSLGADNYKIVYKLSEDQFRSESYRPVQLTMTFQGTTEVIGTLEDGNIPVVPGNPKTDCTFNVTKYVTSGGADYANKESYKELERRRQNFYYSSSFNLTQGGVQTATQSIILSDTIDDRLTILDAYLVAENTAAHADVVSGATPNNTLIAALKPSDYLPAIVPELAQVGNTISYSLPEQPAAIGGSEYPFGGYAGKDYVLVVKARIKDEVSDYEIQTQMRAIDEDGRFVGVPNHSKVLIDSEADGGTQVRSNRARAVPPALARPEISKYVKSQNGTWYPISNTLAAQGESYSYRIEFDMPVDTTGYRELVISDVLDETIELNNFDNISVYYLEKGSTEPKNYLSSQQRVISYNALANELTVTIAEATLAESLFEPMAEGKLCVEFDVKFKENANLASKYSRADGRIIIPNVAGYKLNGDVTFHYSNQVKTYVPLSKVELLKLDSDYVNGSRPPLSGAQFTLVDTTDGTVRDRVFNSSTEGIISVDELVPGHTYTLTETEAPQGYKLNTSNSWSIKVENNGTLNITEGQPGSVEGETITALNEKPIPPQIVKFLKGESQTTFGKPGWDNPYRPALNDEKIIYQAKVQFDSDLSGYSKIEIRDKIDPFLILQSGSHDYKAYIGDDELNEIGGTFWMDIPSRIMSFTKTDGLEELAGKTLTIQIQIAPDVARLNALFEREDREGVPYNGRIPNTVQFILNDQEPVSSNEVIFQLTRGKVNLTKTVSDEDGIEIIPQPSGLSAGFALYRVVGSPDPTSNETNDLKLGDYTVAVGGTLEVANLSPGRYYFLETSAPVGYIRQDGMIPAETFEISNSGGDLQTIEVTADNRKSALPTVSKFVKGINRPEYSTGTYDLSIGEMWQYAIDVTIPETADEMGYDMTDTLCDFFDVEDIRVYSKTIAGEWNSVEDLVAKDFLVPHYSEPNKIKMSIPSTAVANYRGKVIRIEIDVRVKQGTNLLNCNALEADGTIPNTANLTYSTGSQSSTVSVKPVILRDIYFLNKLGNAPLPGAHFQLFHDLDVNGLPINPVNETFSEPSKPYAEYSQHPDGGVTFKNVPAGEYWMVETPPLGKIAIFGLIKVKVHGVVADHMPSIEFSSGGFPVGNNLNGPPSVPNNELVRISGVKTWEDDEDFYGKRPASIQLTLKRKVGEVVDQGFSKTITLTEPWTYAFEEPDQLKFSPFNDEYTYYIVEQSIPFYDTSYDGFNITNTLEEVNFRLFKRDGDTNAPIAGTTFILEDLYVNKKEAISDSNGLIEFTGVKKGVNYRLYEVHNQSYIYNPESAIVNVCINDDGTATLNPPKFELINPNTDNSGYLFLNYKKQKPVMKIKVGETLYNSYNLPSLGEEVTYQITVPFKGTDDINRLEISDTLEPGMMLVGDPTYYLAGGNTLPQGFFTIDRYNDRGVTFVADRAFGKDIDLLKNEDLVIELKAKVALHPSAFAEQYPRMEVPNKAALVINNHYGNRLETDPVYVKAKFTELTFTKKLAIQGGEPSTLPPGVIARFELAKEGITATRLMAVDSDPFVVANLDVGKYTMRETRAPKGYLPVDPIYFEVKNESGTFTVYRYENETQWENGVGGVLIVDNKLGDIVDPHPMLPTLNKMVKPAGFSMSGHVDDNKHHTMTTWKDNIDFVVDFTLPSDMRAYETLTFSDVLPIGLDLVNYAPSIEVGTVGEVDVDDASFTPDPNQTPYDALEVSVSQKSDTRQYMVAMETSGVSLMALAGKTVRITFTAAISDKFTEFSQLTLNEQGNFENTANLKVNASISLYSSATVKPVPQYGLVLRKIADYKDNGSDVPLSGAVFTLSQYIKGSESGPELPAGMATQYVTGTNGIVEIAPRLEPGKYILKETSYPDGYGALYPVLLLELGVDIGEGVMGVRVTAVDDTFEPLVPGVELYEGSAALTSENPLNVVNRERVNVTIRKDWHDDNNARNTRPETFKLTLHRAVVVGEPDTIGSDGQLIPDTPDTPDAPDTNFEMEVDLPAGQLTQIFEGEELYRRTVDGELYNYYVVETVPSGYAASYSAEGTTITNTLIKADGFTLLKQDDANLPNVLEGATFNVAYTDGNGRVIVETKTSNSAGIVDLSNLLANTVYTLEEIEAPAGYKVDTKVYTIVVNELGVPTVYTVYHGADDPRNVEAPNFTATETVPASYQITVTDERLYPPTPDKKIEGESSYNLPSLSSEFEYTIDVPVESVEGMTSFVIEDTVHELLTIVSDSGTVKADGVKISTPENLTVVGKTITFSITSGFDKIAGRTVRLSFKAKVDPTNTLDDLLAFVQEPGNNAGIPNVATVTFNSETADSNAVYLVPGQAGPEPEINKTVNGKDHHNLRANDEVFRYKVSVEVPENVLGYNSLAVVDTLSKVLTVDGDIRLTLLSSDGSTRPLRNTEYVLTNTVNPGAINSDGVITATFVDYYDYTALAGKTIVMEFDAKIKQNVTQEHLNAYADANDGHIKIPNKAHVTWNGNDKTPDEATVTPTGDPTVDKKVNGHEHATLDGNQLDAPITYTINATVPFNTAGMKTFVIRDEVTCVLKDISTMVSISGVDNVSDFVTLTNNNNVITATINGNDKITALAGKTIVLTITASVDKTKDLSDYLEEGKLPNTATITIDGRPAASDNANITPAKGKVSINKTLEGLNPVHDAWPSGEKAIFKLEKKIETVPETWVFVKNVEINSFATVQVDGLLPGMYKLTETSAPSGYMKADSWEFTVTGALGETITHTFNDSKLPSIEKVVDKGFFEATDAERTFTITVPIESVEGLTKLVITDSVDEYLTIVANSVKATLDTVDGTALSVDPAVDGQEITLTLANTYDFSEIEGRSILLTYKVKLKDNFNYKQLPVRYKTYGIPNTAQLVINNNPEVVTDTVNVKVPVAAVTLTKEADGGPLPDGTSATFDLYRGQPDTGTKIGTYSTRKAYSGDIIHVAELVPGDYYFVETMPPYGGYVLNHTPRQFKIVVNNDGYAEPVGIGSFISFRVNNIKSSLPEPVKYVGEKNGQIDQSHLRLDDFNELYSYKVVVDIPQADAIANWTAFTLKDPVDPALAVQNIKVTVGTDVYEIGDPPVAGYPLTFDDVSNTISFAIENKNNVVSFAGKRIVLTFDANIRSGYSTDDFLEDHPNALITNEAILTVTVEETADPLRSDSNDVTVAPPLPMPKPVKYIHGDDQGNLDEPNESFRLGTLEQYFTYEIRLNVPPNVGNNTRVTLTDWMNELLEPVNTSTDPNTGHYTGDSIKIYISDIYIPRGAEGGSLNDHIFYNASDNTITFGVENIDPSNPAFDFRVLEGKEVRMEIRAKFKDDVTQEKLNNYLVTDSSSPFFGSVVIPNQVGLLLGENVSDWQYSNKVNITPPGDEPTVKKTVENNTGTNNDQKDALLLDQKGDEFTYKVKVDIPASVEGYENITVDDTLENVLQIISTDVLVDSVSDSTLKNKVARAGNNVSLTVTEGFATYAGKSITLEIKAKINDDVTLDQIAHDYGRSAIPNKATLTFNGAAKNSNEVTVTPPGGTPKLVKSVNAQTDIVLGDITDEFVYNISYTIPTNVNGYKSLIMKDVLEKVLTTKLTDIQVYVDEVQNDMLKAFVTTSTANEATTVMLTMGTIDTPFDFKPYAGKTIRVEMMAKIKGNADLSSYQDRRIPNEATLKLNENTEVSSNQVTLQPPTGSVILTKVVDGEPLSGTQTATFKLYKVLGVIDATPGIPAGQDEADELIQINGLNETAVNAANNKITVTGLEPGDYYFVETAAPTGYTLNNSPIAFTITPDQSVAAALTWNNVSDLTPVKTVNHNKTIEVKDFGQVFTYRVSVPVGSVSAIKEFVIRDEVDQLLEIVPNSAKVYKQDGTVLADHDSDEIDVVNSVVSFTRTSDFIVMTNSLVTLEFKAKLKTDITAGDLSTDVLNEGIPNKATLTVNDQQPVDSDTVYVKPVLGDVTLTKTAEGKPLGAGQTATFALYKISGVIDTTPSTPVDQDDTADVKIGDDRMTDSGKITVTNLISGTYYFVETVAPAGYKLDATPVTFTVYGGEKAGKNPVAVTVDNEAADVPTPVKTVDDVQSLTLDSLTQEFTYKVSVSVGDVDGVTNFVICDEVDAFLEVVPGSASVKINQTDVGGSVEIDGPTVTYTASDDDIVEMAGKTVTLQFDATIKQGTTYEDLSDQYADLKVPNTAKLQINNTWVDSNTVTVKPVFGKVSLVKTSDGSPLPNGLSAIFSLYRVTGGNEELIRDYQTINGKIEVSNLSPGSYYFVEKYAPAGHILDETKRVFTIKDDAATEPVAGASGANLTVDNKTPKDGPTIEKSVEGSNHYVLATQGEEVTYTIRMKIPEQVDGYQSLILEDEVDPFFVIASAAVAVESGYTLQSPDDGVLTYGEQPNPNLVKYTFAADFDYSKIAGQDVVMTVKVALADSVTAADVAETYLDNNIPNTAKQIFNGTTTNSNTVTVKLLGDKPSINKNVEGANNLNLSHLAQTFKYNINVLVPSNTQGYEKLEVVDTLENVLEYVSAEVRVGGTKNEALTGKVTAEPVTLGGVERTVVKLSLDNMYDYNALAGKLVTLVIKARIKEGADLTSYINDGGIPNSASLYFNSDPAIDTGEVTVTPPGSRPSIEKEVSKGNMSSGGASLTLDRDDQEFYYRLIVKVPSNVQGYESVVLEDVLEDVLVPPSKSDVKLYLYKLGSEEYSDLKYFLTDDAITVDGQRVRIRFAKDSFNTGYSFDNAAGRTLLVAIKTRIKDGADLSGYEGGKIPNKATLAFNGVPKTSNEVWVEPPGVLTLDKKVNGTEEVKLNDLGDMLTYTMQAVIPEDIKGVSYIKLTDTFADILELQGNVSVEVKRGGTVDDDLSEHATSRLTTVGQTVTLNITDRADDYIGTMITVTVKAKIDQSKDLVSHLVDGAIPNTANLQINGKTWVDSNTVKVIPILGKVVLTKTSGEEELPKDLSAVFSLYKVNGTEEVFMREYVTVDGKIEVINLGPGQYFFVERHAPKGHILDPTKHSFVVDTTGKADPANFTVDNTQLETTSFTVTQEWVGGPADKPTVFVQLYRSLGDHKEPYGMPVMLENGTKTYTWNNLPATTLIGEVFTYSVDEPIVPDGYTKEISEDGKTITNTYVPSLIDLEVRKIWAGVEHPEDYKATFRLKANGDSVDGRVITITGNAIGCFEDLPETDTNGNVISYDIVEDPVQGFSSRKLGTGESCCDYFFVNTRDSSVGHFTFKCIDHMTKEPLRGATFDLREHNSPHRLVATATSDAKGEVRFSNIKEGMYQLVQTAYPSGYRVFDVIRTAVVDHNGDVTIGGENLEEDYTISNIPKLTPLTLVKIDSMTRAILPDAVFDVYRSKSAVENPTSAAAHVDDVPEQGKSRAATIAGNPEIERLKRSLAAAEERVRELEQAIVKSKRSAERRAELEREKVEAEEHLNTLKNTLTASLTQATEAVNDAYRTLQTATKSLQTAEAELDAFRLANTDGKLDAHIIEHEEMVARLSDEKEQAQRQYDDALAEKEAVKEKNTDLMREATEELAGIVAQIEAASVDTEQLLAKKRESEARIAELKSMISKLEENGRTTETAPTSDGKSGTRAPAMPSVQSAEQSSIGMVEELPGDVELVGIFTTDENGVIVLPDLSLGTYYVVEKQAPAGYLKSTTIYEVRIMSDADGQITPVVLLTENDPNPAMFRTQVTVTKYWLHDGHVSVPAVTMILKANGVEVDRVTLEPGQYQHTFRNLLIYDTNMDEIDYTITEVGVPGYTGVVDRITQYDFVVINTASTVVEPKAVTVFTLWLDGEEYSATVRLLANGVDTGKKLVLDTLNDWFGTFEGLPAVDSEGREIVYTIAQLPVKGYEMRIIGDERMGFIIVNKKVEALKPEEPVKPEKPGKPEGQKPPASSSNRKPSKQKSSKKSGSVNRIPVTGERNVVIVPIVLFAFGAALLYVGGRRKRRSRHHQS